MIKLYKEKNIFKVLELKTCDCCLVPMSHFLCALLYGWGYIKKKNGRSTECCGCLLFLHLPKSRAKLCSLSHPSGYLKTEPSDLGLEVTPLSVPFVI